MVLSFGIEEVETVHLVGPSVTSLAPSKVSANQNIHQRIISYDVEASKKRQSIGGTFRCQRANRRKYFVSVGFWRINFPSKY